MNIKLCVLFAATITMVTGFDLGPAMRIAQCRSLCLRRHQEAEECEESRDCKICWESCSLLENDWTVWGTVCQDDEEICYAGCKTACAYHATRVEEQFLPSTLPAPMPGPVYLQAYDVAILFRKIDEDWEEMNQYPGEGVMTLNKTTWIVVVAENGVRQYSGEFWKPNLEMLKEGALFEASLSWTDDDAKDNQMMDDSEQREIDSDIARLNSKMAIDFEDDDVLKNALRNSEVGKNKVAVESTNEFYVTKRSFEATTEELARIRPTPTTQKSSDIGKIRLYFASAERSYFDEQNVRILSDVSPDNDGESKTEEIVEDDLDEENDDSEKRPEIYHEEPTRLDSTPKNSVEKIINDVNSGAAKSTSPSYIVSWEPETGGLMGNQVTEARSTQISLLPGTKYLVRVASNDGPGSFALEIDTTIKSVKFSPLEAVAADIQPWAILAGCASALMFVALAILIKLCRRNTTDDKLDYV